MSFSPTNAMAPFVTTATYIPEEFEQFRIKFLELYRQLAVALNIREIAVYDLTEFLTGEQWFTTGDPQTKRQTFRKVFEFSDASLTFNHNITGATFFTHIYGAAFDTGTTLYYPIPYVSATAANNQIQIDVSATQVIVTKGAGAPPAITSGIIVLEYLKN